MSKKSKPAIVLILSLVGAIGILGFILLFPKLQVYWSGMTVTCNKEVRTFLLKEPLTSEALAALLADQNIVDKPEDLLKVATYKKLSKERIAAGMYEISPLTSYRTLLIS